MSNELSDEQLLYLVGQTDKKLFEAGEHIGKRQFAVISDVMKQLGHTSYIMFGFGAPPIVDRINNAFKSIYQPHDLAICGHIGVFMYRDIFARIDVPIIFGETSINPFEFVELTHVQMRMINHEPEQMAIYIDQFNDVADIQYGVDELNEPYRDQELTVRFIGLARLHLHAAAAVVTGGYDHRGAVQSALLASELALKAGLAAQGLDEDQIKDEYGHKLKKSAAAVKRYWPKFDVDRVQRVIDKQPGYVLNRYSPDQPDRQQVGHTVMGAQYLVAEVVRQMSDRDFRSCMSPPEPRVYPA